MWLRFETKTTLNVIMVENQSQISNFLTPSRGISSREV